MLGRLLGSSDLVDAVSFEAIVCGFEICDVESATVVIKGKSAIVCREGIEVQVYLHM